MNNTNNLNAKLNEMEWVNVNLKQQLSEEKKG